jgi:hypothetical protein
MTMTNLSSVVSAMLLVPSAGGTGGVVSGKAYRAP